MIPAWFDSSASQNYLIGQENITEIGWFAKWSKWMKGDMLFLSKYNFLSMDRASIKCRSDGSVLIFSLNPLN